MSSIIISSLSAPTSDMLTFTGLDLSGYRVVTLVVWGLSVGTDDVEVYLRVSQSGSFLSGASDYSFASPNRSTTNATQENTSNGAAFIAMSDASANYGVGNAAGKVFSMRIELVNVEAGEPRHFLFSGGHVGPTGSAIRIQGQGVVNNTTDIDGLRILLSSGTMTAGKAVLIGTA